jgi:hypothetical protein
MNHATIIKARGFFNSLLGRGDNLTILDSPAEANQIQG